MISARSTREQGVYLNGVSLFVFDRAAVSRRRLEARSGELRRGIWVLQDVRVFKMGEMPVDEPEYRA